MAKAKLLTSPSLDRLFFNCIACDGIHYVNTRVDTKFKADFKIARGFDIPVWVFNGDLVSPTITPPSISMDDDNIRKGVTMAICHFTVTKGQLIYSTDCTHKWAGKTVDMTEIK